MTQQGDEGNKDAKDNGQSDPPDSKPGNATGGGDKPKEVGAGIPDDIKEFIRETVREVTGKGSPKTPDKPDDSGDGRPRSWARRIEEQAEEAVRNATEKVFKEKEHELAHKKLDKVPEAPPSEKGKVPFLQRVLWGE